MSGGGIARAGRAIWLILSTDAPRRLGVTAPGRHTLTVRFRVIVLSRPLPIGGGDRTMTRTLVGRGHEGAGRSVKWLKKALGLKGRERATALVTEGFVQAHDGRLDEALRSYEEAIDADETFAVAWLNLGLCRLDLYNRDGNALDEDDRARALRRIAEALEKALALDETSAVGWRALARVEERRAAWARAEEAWQKAEAAAAAGAETAEVAEAQKARRAVAAKAHADRVRSRALQALDGAVDVEERRAALAALLPLLEQPGEAAEVLVRGLSLAGTLARRVGDADQARKLLERAVAADARDHDALRELASVCLEAGDLSRALAVSLDAYRAQPTSPGLVCNVGVCHLGLGDLEEAAEFIDLAFRLDPKDPIVLRAREALSRARNSVRT